MMMFENSQKMELKLLFYLTEVHAINENSHYLAQLVNDIGIQLKSTAVCTHIHRLRYGVFDLDHTLLKKEWNIVEIARNIRKCQTLLTPENLLTDIQLSSKSERQDVDLLSDSINVTDDKGPSTEEILELDALEELSELREKLLQDAKKKLKDADKTLETCSK